MDLLMGPLVLVWAQAQPVATNPSSLGPLALRRWCGGLTLSAPQFLPSAHGFWALLAGLAVLFLAAAIAQGPLMASRQLLDIPGHVRLARVATARARRAGRLVAALITFTVVSWTGAQTMVFAYPGGRADLLLLTKARGLGELALEQGVLAGLTPLRDVAGLGDNLPLLIVAAIVVFRASIDPRTSGRPGESSGGRPRPGWTTVIWGAGSLYILYRIVARVAGSVDLPLGGCLIVESVLVPMAMVVVDGFLLAWLLTELRNAGLATAGEDRLDLQQAIELMPGAALACVVALPSRYLATFVVLANDHLPTSIHATGLGQYIRWQLGWGLIDLQAVGLVLVGLVGVVAWGRGRIVEAVGGYRRCLAAEGGHLVVALAMAAAAAASTSAIAYSVVLLLPAQTWVLGAADAYAHFATLPVGTWTLAALIELAGRSLPTASLARPHDRQARAEAEADADTEPGPAVRDALPTVSSPTS